MKRTSILTALGFLSLVACGASQSPAETPENNPCSPQECGPEPPIAPAACPAGESISSVCKRDAKGTCERHVLCNGAERTEQPAK
jgi:hypothetical protein